MGLGLLAPQQLPLVRIIAGENAGDAESADLAFGRRRRTARPWMAGAGSGHGVRLVLVLPLFVAAGRVQAADDFLLALSRKHENLIADQDRRRIAESDFDAPLFGEFLGPCLGFNESDHLVVAVGSAPLRPVLGADADRAQHKNATRQHRRRLRALSWQLPFDFSLTENVKAPYDEKPQGTQRVVMKDRADNEPTQRPSGALPSARPAHAELAGAIAPEAFLFL